SRTWSRSAVGDLPLDMLKSRLLAMWEEERFPEAARELTEAAWSRPVEEVIELSDWLEERGAAMTPETFVADAGRLRPLEEALAFAPEAVLDWHPRMRDLGRLDLVGFPEVAACVNGWRRSRFK
ncbi:hypothetical protein, partial [Streptomyces sp. NRRL B-24572]|uniref:hypothetical protein n=1 Tax=Streptomyces sp. NRRL B-24572 TaxID=1962156 RepID=UPI001C4F68C8